MKEHPIIFSGPMIRAILEGRKTQTRRIVKFSSKSISPNGPYVESDGNPESLLTAVHELQKLSTKLACPYGTIGDRLWVRESFARVEPYPQIGERYEMPMGAPVSEVHREYWRKRIAFKADTDESFNQKWKPSIHMPRWASRITLEITDIRIERIQEVSDSDAFSEGIQATVNEGQLDDGTAKGAFKALWNSINVKRASWESNPYVWALTFRRITT
jgi:hypothetical protein